MDNKEELKEIARCIAKHVPQEEFILCCLCSLRTDEERSKLIEYLSTHENLSKTDIDIKIIEITRKRYSAQYGIK